MLSMRARARAAGAAALVAACTPAAPKPEAMLAAADSLDARFAAAFNRGDAAALAALYADSGAISIGPDGTIATGRAEIEAGFRSALATMPGLRLELTEHHSQVVGTAVVTWGKSRLTTSSAGKVQVLMEGRFSDVKAERGGRWVYIIDHASTPTPPPAPGEAAPSR